MVPAWPAPARTHPPSHPHRAGWGRRKTGAVSPVGGTTQGLMMTRVPIGTSGYSSSESEMYMRMQPCEA